MDQRADPVIRLYIELDAVHDRELLADRGVVTPEKLAAVANGILYPYTLEVKDVGWPKDFTPPGKGSV